MKTLSKTMSEMDNMPYIIEEYYAPENRHGYNGYPDADEANDDWNRWVNDPDFHGTATLYKWNGTEYEAVDEINRQNETASTTAHKPRASRFLRPLLTVLLVTATVLATAHMTYRATMRQIHVEINSATSTAYLTAWGQTDSYTYETVEASA